MTPRAPQLLVSVRNAEEAVAALDGGATIIDIKEPSRGPLGMADPKVIEQIIRAVAGRVPVSAALGELIEDRDLTKVPVGLTYAKIGLAKTLGRPWHNALTGKFAQLAKIRPVAVAYWDCDVVRAPQELEVLEWAVAHRAAALLIDTADKSGPGLLAGLRPIQTRGRWTQQKIDDVRLLRMMMRLAAKHRIRVALAGSLTGERLRQAIRLGPDIIAVRSAACRKFDRKQPVARSHVRVIAQMIVDEFIPRS